MYHQVCISFCNAFLKTVFWNLRSYTVMPPDGAPGSAISVLVVLSTEQFCVRSQGDGKVKPDSSGRCSLSWNKYADMGKACLRLNIHQCFATLLVDIEILCSTCLFVFFRFDGSTYKFLLALFVPMLVQHNPTFIWIWGGFMPRHWRGGFCVEKSPWIPVTERRVTKRWGSQKIQTWI